MTSLRALALLLAACFAASAQTYPPTGAGGASFHGTPTATAIVTDYSVALLQPPDPNSTLDGSGNLGVSGSMTSGEGCTSTACISSDTWDDSGATHATVQLGATTGYNGTNTWDGNAPTSGYFWGAYNVSGNNALVGWVAPAGVMINVSCSGDVTSYLQSALTALAAGNG